MWCFSAEYICKHISAGVSWFGNSNCSFTPDLADIISFLPNLCKMKELNLLGHLWGFFQNSQIPGPHFLGLLRKTAEWGTSCISDIYKLLSDESTLIRTHYLWYTQINHFARLSLILSSATLKRDLHMIQFFHHLLITLVLICGGSLWWASRGWELLIVWGELQ